MSKYGPLEDYLRNRGDVEVAMTFREVEQIIADSLPPSAFRHRAWWSNNPSNSVITHAWLRAGYESADVDMAARKLVFRRSVQDGAGSEDRQARTGRVDSVAARTPSRGILSRVLSVPTARWWRR